MNATQNDYAYADARPVDAEASPTEEPGREAIPSGYGFEDLMRSTFQRPAPLIEGLLHEGHAAIFAAGFGEGKTFFALQMSICLAAGRDFLGRKVGRPYRTVFLDAENGKGEIKERVAKLMAQLNLTPEEHDNVKANWHLEDFEDDGLLHWLNLADETSAGKLRKYIEQYQPEVMIFDCLGKVFPKNERDEEPIKQLCDRLVKLLRGCESLRKGLLLFLHHTTKFNADAAGYNLLDHPREFLGKVRGSGRLLDLVQDRLAMESLRTGAEEPYYVVNGIVRSGVITPLILRRNEIGFFELHDDTELLEQKAFGSAPRQKELYLLMKERFGHQPTFTYTEVSNIPPLDGKKFYPDTVANALKAACLNGLLVKAGNAYAFPNGGGTAQR
jgi:hypothetical protein